MKYVLLIYTNAAAWSGLPAPEQERVIQVHYDLMDELTRSGEFLRIYRMADAANTKTVRIDAGVPAVTDGPFGEAKEMLASLWEIEVESVERAVEIATPISQYGRVEVTPLMDDAGLEM